MTSPIPLRERLAAALANPGRCEHAGCESCDQWWRADAALLVVRDWLRERAMSHQGRADRYQNSTARSIALVRVDELIHLADAIDKELNRDS